MLKLVSVIILIQGLHINCKVMEQGWSRGQFNKANRENVNQTLLMPENIPTKTESHLKSTKHTHKYSPIDDIPDSLDWRDKGVVTPVQSQMISGVITIVEMVESDLAVETGKLVQLSIQQIYDCCSRCNASGIISMRETLKYIQNFGLESASDYPLHERSNSSCKYNSNLVVQGTKGATFEMVKQGNETDLKIICAMTGPVFVMVDVIGSFETYSSGIYYDKDCDPEKLNHSMLLVGYGTEGGEDYWIVKNSWGSNWGEMGYAKMSRNRNDNCGIAEFAFVMKTDGTS